MLQIGRWRPEIHNGQDLTAAYGSGDLAIA